MSIKKKIQNLVSPLYNPLYNKVWYGPKGKIKERVKKACEDMPHKQRLTVVTVLLSAFILVAFFVFGNACYKMGAGHARQAIEIEHIRQLDLPTQSAHDVSPKTVEDETAR